MRPKGKNNKNQSVKTIRPERDLIRRLIEKEKRKSCNSFQDKLIYRILCLSHQPFHDSFQMAIRLCHIIRSGVVKEQQKSTKAFSFVLLCFSLSSDIYSFWLMSQIVSHQPPGSCFFAFSFSSWSLFECRQIWQRD